MSDTIIFESAAVPVDCISRNSVEKKLQIDWDEITEKYRQCSVGSATLRQFNKLKRDKTKMCKLKIVEKSVGSLGREKELVWLTFPNKISEKKITETEKEPQKNENKNTEKSSSKKEVEVYPTPREFDDLFNDEFPINQRDREFLRKGKGKMAAKKSLMGDVFAPFVLEKLKIDPQVEGKNFFMSILPHFQKLFNLPSKEILKKTFRAFAKWISIWLESIDETEKYGPPYNAVVISKTTSIWFGIAPGHPQCVIFDSELERLSAAQPSALAIGLPFTFSEVTYDDDGKVIPNGIESKLPFYPQHPNAIAIPKESSIEEVKQKLIDTNGESILDCQPVALARMKMENQASSRQSFEKLMKDVARELGADVTFEDQKWETKNLNTYRYLDHWCLMYRPGTPVEEFLEKKDLGWFGKFPINWYIGPNPFEFTWMDVARGRVHDLTHPAILRDEKEQKKDDYWIIIGDETGSGKELWHEKHGKGGKTAGQRKKFAYIWVVVPPKVALPSTPSDFHAMDQRTYQKPHLEALQTLSINAQNGLHSLIFEATNYVNESERSPREVKNPVPQVINATLPLVLQHISMKTKPDGKPVKICIMSERIGEEWNIGYPNIFVKTEIKKWMSNLEDRGRFSKLVMKDKDFQIYPKLDHPWMNYPDALGFLHGGALPSYLEEYKQALEPSTVVSPFYFDFLSTQYPELLTQLAQNPYAFIEKLCSCKVEHLQGYMDPYLSSLIEEALGKFNPMDWKKFNELMIKKQVTNQGRIISKKVTQWASPQLSKILEVMDSDIDRLNMCLTLAWSMDQQGGDVLKYLEMIHPDWIKKAPESRRKSFIAVFFAHLQNQFILDPKNLISLTKFGLIEHEILDSNSLLQKLIDSNSSPEQMRIYGQIFSYLALDGLNQNINSETMWECNEKFVQYKPWKPEDVRRHCIYGAELSLDFVSENDIWFKRAKARLFSDFDETLGSGEGQEVEQFWWPAAARYYTLCLEHNSIKIDTEKLNSFIQRADQYTRDSLPIVKIRTSYWLLRLSLISKINIESDVFENLVELFKQWDEPRDIYGVLMIEHIIDINRRIKGEVDEVFEHGLDSVLGRSSEHTRSYFELWVRENPNSPKLESLRFNYS